MARALQQYLCVWGEHVQAKIPDLLISCFLKCFGIIRYSGEAYRNISTFFFYNNIYSTLRGQYYIQNNSILIIACSRLWNFERVLKTWVAFTYLSHYFSTTAYSIPFPPLWGRQKHPLPGCEMTGMLDLWMSCLLCCKPYKKLLVGNLLVAQWWELHVSTAGSTGSVPGRGTKFPQATW